jgi:hypothetical protein
MIRGLIVAMLVSGCEVYDASLLTGGDGGNVDAPAEACGTMCGSTCTNTQTDQNNCGSCGHACEVGCSNGLCKPTVLASSLTAPHGLVVQNSSIWVAMSGAINIQVMSKVDGTGLKDYAQALVQPDRMTTDGVSLFWTDNTNLNTGGNLNNPGGGVWEGGLTGNAVNCTGVYCFYVRDLPSPYDIAVQGSTMFFTTTGGTNNSGGGCPANAWTNSVLSCPKTGCIVASCNASGGPTVIAANQTQLASIAADTKNVYWADFGGKEVRSCSIPCASPKVFATSLGGPFGVVSDGTTVYFTDRTDGIIYACPTSGCGTSPQQLANGLTDPFLLAVDGTTLYATLYGKGELVACTLPSCAGGPVVLASGLHAPYAVATDSTYVYWTEEGSSGAASSDGAVSKLRKN